MPLLAPVAEKLGIDLVWFGVLLSVNMQTSFLHPPFGFALFYLRSVAPKQVRTADIYRGAIPFLCIQLFMVGLLIAFPQLATVDRHDFDNTPAVRLDVPVSNDFESAPTVFEVRPEDLVNYWGPANGSDGPDREKP